ncbi:MAG: formate dehydrogenase accessory protein FdhE, partial [Actinomycetota bacterium]
VGGVAPPALVPRSGGRASGPVRRASAHGAPGDFARRLERAGAIEPSEPIRAPLALLVDVLEHQLERASSTEVVGAVGRVAEAVATNRLLDRFPLLHLEAAIEALCGEIERAADRLGASPATPAPLEEAGRALGAGARREAVQTWLDDPSLLDPRTSFWIAVAAAPILEGAAANLEPPSKAEWSSSACPACGGPPQVSVIEERSGEFMVGAPRQLVCSRCALWWSFARATCPWCGEDNSKKLSGFASEQAPYARIDVCDTCRAYMKTFDLREPGGKDVVPLVDDVATLTLDVWAHEQGLGRPSLSLAGV